jgi:hypothetical protein
MHVAILQKHHDELSARVGLPPKKKKIARQTNAAGCGNLVVRSDTFLGQFLVTAGETY